MARIPLPQVGHKWVRAVLPMLSMLLALAFRSWRFCSTDWVSVSSAIFSRVWTVLRHAEQLSAAVVPVSLCW